MIAYIVASLALAVAVVALYMAVAACYYVGPHARVRIQWPRRKR